MSIEKKYKITKGFLIFWCLFIGLGALGGGTCMLIKPDGSILSMQAMLPYFKVLPFSDVLFKDYVFSGIALIIVNGITNIVASALIIKNKKVGVVLGAVFGVTLMLWITIQFIIFPCNFLSTAYFIFGFLQAVTGYICFAFFMQNRFKFNTEDYKNIGANGENLVVYYSRDGYTKKIAYELANENGADVLEIKPTERTRGFLGFMWCGRFAMHKWGMPIEKINVDMERYRSVTLCSPIWVFGLSSPMVEFCKQNSGKIKNVSYVFVHFMKVKFKKVADKTDKILKTERSSYTSVCCRFGNVKNQKQV